ncbi:hypothetical protein OL233_01925 [Vagococcus sp. PNs007]|uniref:Uncharacterized protein n=2 Tax=Vagococcus proximus TaxID=2991417 RepID=A0ABT5WZC2_9ENTE|nr:hypothetical protein [Vagococcus proximus]
MKQKLVSTISAYVIGMITAISIWTVVDIFTALPNEKLSDLPIGFVSALLWNFIGLVPYFGYFIIWMLLFITITFKFNLAPIKEAISIGILSILSILTPITLGYFRNFKYEEGYINSIRQWGIPIPVILLCGVAVAIISYTLATKAKQK